MVGPIITKVLITTRFRLNALIDEDSRRPPEVTREQWETLVKIRRSDAGVKKSEHMRAISKGKGSKALQFRAIERDAIIKLSILHKRAPYASEIATKVDRECQRQEEEKIRGSADKNNDFSDMRTRVVDMEGTVTRLEDKMDASHRRVEDMVQQLLQSLSPMGATSLPGVRPSVAVTDGTNTPRTGTDSSVLASRAGAGIVSSVLNEEEDLVAKNTDQADGEFVQSLFAEEGPDGVGDAGVSTDVPISIALGNASTSVEEVVTSTGEPAVLEDDDVYVVGGHDQECFIAHEGDSAQELLHSDKMQEVSDIAGDSAGRGRRSLKSLQSLKVQKFNTPTRTSKATQPKSATPSKTPTTNLKQGSQGKKLEPIKKK